MMRLVVTVFMTVDGVIESPGFDEHRDGRNTWALRVQNEARSYDLSDLGSPLAHRNRRRGAPAEARASQVIVTRTVRDLATGTDLVFDPLGQVSLRGIPGQWELFDASNGEGSG